MKHALLVKMAFAVFDFIQVVQFCVDIQPAPNDRWQFRLDRAPTPRRLPVLRLRFRPSRCRRFLWSAMLASFERSPVLEIDRLIGIDLAVSPDDNGASGDGLSDGSGGDTAEPSECRFSN